MKKINIVIPVKKTSDRVKNKNFREFYKKQSLFQLLIKKLQKSKFVKNIFISSNKTSIEKEVNSIGCKFIYRENMPLSKRQKVVALTKVKKQGREAKETVVEKVQEAVDTYKNIFVLSFEHLRSGPFRKIAQDMKEDSKFFIGKNKVLQVALGRTPEEEYADNTHLISKYLKWHVCVLATQKKKEEIEQKLQEEEVDDFATAGCTATYEVFL